MSVKTMVKTMTWREKRPKSLELLAPPEFFVSKDVRFSMSQVDHKAASPGLKKQEVQ
jgi:hypothetical protein